MNENKIKIAFIIDQLAIGGTERQLLSSINLLDRSKFEPILFCLRDSEYYHNINLNAESYVLGIYSVVSVKGLYKFIKLVRLLRKEKADIVQTFFIDSNLIGILAAKIAGVKTIIGTRRDLGYWYNSSLLKKIRQVNKLADRFLVNSFAIKEVVAKEEGVPPDKIDVIYNGIDLEPFNREYDTADLKKELNIPADDKVVGIVANLNREVKRVDLFVEAAALVLRRYPQVTFIIIGEGHLKTGLKARAAKLGISEKILFLGSQKNIPYYLSVFDIGVLTSDSEGFSNSILEYMAAGLPVVCTDVGGNKEVIKDGENGFLFQPGNYKQLSEKIEGIISNYDKNIGKRNRTTVNNFSIEKQMERIELYYRSQLNKYAYKTLG